MVLWLSCVVNFQQFLHIPNRVRRHASGRSPTQVGRQAQRTTIQATAVATFYNVRAGQLRNAMLQCEMSLANRNAATGGAWPTLRSAYERVAEQLELCWATVRWTVLYEKNDSAFFRDGRGRHERAWILSEEDIAMRFDEHFGLLLSSEDCSVDKMAQFVNKMGPGGLFQDAAKAQVLKKYGLKFPVCARTVHRWMIRRGGRYSGHSNGFYTDRHEDPDVVLARNRYLDEHSELMARQPMFIHLKDDEVCMKSVLRYCDDHYIALGIRCIRRLPPALP